MEWCARNSPSIHDRSQLYSTAMPERMAPLFLKTMPIRKPVHALGAISFAIAIAASGCATTGSHSVSARPTFYPNAKLNQAGGAKANEDTDGCMATAQGAGLTPDDKNNAVAHDAAKGAAMGGVAGAVSALVHGRGVEKVVERGAAGAVVGGSVGAVHGAFDESVNPTYRHYVQRCLKDKGYDVIGWN